MLTAKIALGSANFGQPYGIANKTGKLCSREVAVILKEAFFSGVRCLDTAVGYGESESVLGDAGVSGWNVVTKLPPLPEGETDTLGWVLGTTKDSLRKLGLESLDGLLLHKPVDLLGANGPLLYKALQECKALGLTSRIGISIYDPDALESSLQLYPIDIVQAPFNVLDRRIQKSGWLARLRDKDIEIHARSTFLQGLLLMSKEERPSKFDRWGVGWQAWHNWLRESGTTALEACLALVLERPEITRVVLGVDSCSHLSEIFAASKLGVAVPSESLASNDSDLINPFQWSSL